MGIWANIGVRPGISVGRGVRAAAGAWFITSLGACGGRKSHEQKYDQQIMSHRPFLFSDHDQNPIQWQPAHSPGSVKANSE